MRSLYISHMGMTEPLGQSQVLPYLAGLASRGAEIEILSYEPADAKPDAIESLRERLTKQGLVWRPTVRSKGHGLPLKVWESSVGVACGLLYALRRRPQIVHARSYLPAAVADMIASISPGAKLLFDCRGMLGDEYVEAGSWTKDSLNYRLIKRFERRAFARTEGLVVLTKALEKWLGARSLLGRQTQTAVIPCCVDTDRFRPHEASRARLRRELGLENAFVVVYSGSLGAWYGEEEMARLVGHMKRITREGEAPIKFLILTRFATDRFRAAARAAGLAEDDVVVRSVASADMPDYLAAGDLGLSLIQPCFSKTGSSPTKVAEYLGAGMPVIVNAGVGDQAELGEDAKSCIVLRDLGDAELQRGAAAARALGQVPYAERSAATYAVARARFSLAEIGVPRYEALYRALCGSGRAS